MAKPSDDEHDWLGLVLTLANPALIMGLVGSLSFFLLDVGYGGQYADRLKSTLFFFVFGAVLCSRIALLMGSGRAFLYALGLGGATFVAAMRFTSGLGTLGILAIIFVIAASTYQLTKDCTVVATPAGRGRANGKSVIWFTLAAWPLFGFGQSLIPPEASDRRSAATFWLVVYVACGLALLSTTALVNLREELRERKLRLPIKITAWWLAFGALVIVAALGLGWLVPRPHPEGAYAKVTPIDSVERDASKNAPNAEKGGKGDGQPGGKGKGADDEGKGKGEADPKAKGKPQPGEKGEGGDKKGKEEGGKEKGDSDDAKPSPPPAGPIVSNAMNAIKVLFQIVVGVLLVLLLLYALLRFSAGFSDKMRRWLDGLTAWWANLFGSAATEDEPYEPMPAAPPRPFAAFSDPFGDGTATGLSDEELTRYSFAALEAWARQNELAKTADETPLEFAHRIGVASAELRPSTQRLASLYAIVAYRPGRTTPGGREALREFWQAIGRTPAPESVSQAP